MFNLDLSAAARRLARPALLVVPAAVIVVGTLYPVAGLAVPALVLLAAASSLFKKRWFCSRACPRGEFLSRTLGRVSRRKPLPRVLRTPGVRTFLFGFLILCSVGQTLRLRADMAALGGFFWLVCVSTLALSLVMGLVWKPRAWCAVCPVGALQDNVFARAVSTAPATKE